MYLSKQREKLINEIFMIHKVIMETNIHLDLVRKEPLGDANFEGLIPQFNQIRNYVESVDSKNLYGVSTPILNDYLKKLEKINGDYESIKKFNLKASEPLSRRNSLSDEFLSDLDQFYTSLINVRLNLQLFEEDSLLHKANSIIFSLEEEKNKALENVANTQAEISKILEAAKNAAGSIAVKRYATVFENESKYHGKQSNIWLGVTILILSLTAFIGIKLIDWLEFVPDNSFANIQFTITKVIILIVFFYAISICTKNFRAHKHNSILNKHRQNSLQTFEAFIAASNDEQTKNAVLLQTTQTIFSNQQTGYSTGENDGEMPSKIIEIIKTAGPGGKTT